MQQRPAIAVVAPNVLMGVGLKAILEKICLLYTSDAADE